MDFLCILPEHNNALHAKPWSGYTISFLGEWKSSKDNIEEDYSTLHM